MISLKFSLACLKQEIQVKLDLSNYFFFIQVTYASIFALVTFYLFQV